MYIVGPQEGHGHDHLDGVAEGGVQEPAQHVVPQAGRQLLCRVAQDLRQRDHREEVQPEDGGVAEAELAPEHAQGAADQEEAEGREEDAPERRRVVGAGLLHTCHILPPSEIDLGLCLAVFAGSRGKYLFHRIG